MPFGRSRAHPVTIDIKYERFQVSRKKFANWRKQRRNEQAVDMESAPAVRSEPPHTRVESEQAEETQMGEMQLRQFSVQATWIRRTLGMVQAWGKLETQKPKGRSQRTTSDAIDLATSFRCHQKTQIPHTSTNQ